MNTAHPYQTQSNQTLMDGNILNQWVQKSRDMEYRSAIDAQSAAFRNRIIIGVGITAVVTGIVVMAARKGRKK